MDQGYPNLEYIIVDGGSTDDSVAIIQKYENRLAYWVSETDRGQSHAINKGFETATGDIFCWLNSDDLFRPGALRTVGHYFHCHPDHRILHGACEMIDRDGKTWTDKFVPDGIRRLEWKPAEAFANWVEKWFAQQSTFWTADLWHEVGGLDTSLHYTMDVDLWRKFCRCAELHVTEDVLACYRMHPDAKCTASPDAMYLELMENTAHHGSQELREFWDSYGSIITNSFRKTESLRSAVETYERSRWLRCGRTISDLIPRLRWGGRGSDRG